MIPINEVFGPTVQGEGLEIGAPCYFIRVHNCPVKCKECDTWYTWNGSENAKYMWSEKDLDNWFHNALKENPGCGLVVSGGEPLLYYKNEEFIKFLESVQAATWNSIETSGFIGPQSILNGPPNNKVLMSRFLNAFTTVCCSPKITKSLHGQWTDEELTSNIPFLLDTRHDKRLIFKLVCGGEKDIETVCRFNEKFNIQGKGHPIYIMPLGNDPQEILAQCDKLVPMLAKYGFILSPRLHSIIWGNVRGR